MSSDTALGEDRDWADVIFSCMDVESKDGSTKKNDLKANDQKFVYHCGYSTRKSRVTGKIVECKYRLGGQDYFENVYYCRKHYANIHGIKCFKDASSFTPWIKVRRNKDNDVGISNAEDNRDMHDVSIK